MFEVLQQVRLRVLHALSVLRMAALPEGAAVLRVACAVVVDSYQTDSYLCPAEDSVRCRR